MIRPAPGVIFTTAADGDMRDDPAARQRIGLGSEWATVRQVHGNAVQVVYGPGDHGDADGLVTDVPGLPLAVFTADCLGIVLHGPDRVAVVHAGWRGVAAGVVESALTALGRVDTVHVGPHIRACCFEVGPEVADRFSLDLATTSWGTTSVDLASAISRQLPVEPDVSDRCTRCGDDSFSHRRNGTPARMAAIGWLP